MEGSADKKNRETRRVHLVNLFKWRSGVALAACLITLVVSFGAIGYSFITIPLEAVRGMFKWFTVDSNLLTGLAAVMIIPFAAEGISRKRLTYPKWVQRIHYSGTICLTLTLIFACGFISWYDPVTAFGGVNLYLHILCPVMILVSFFMVESNYKLDRRDNLIALLPIAAYAVWYYYNVIVTGKWDDHYNLNAYIPIQASAVLAFILSYLIGWLIRTMYNRLISWRERKRKLIWEEDIDPVSVRIEIYSLGFHAGLYEEKEDVSVPFDILEDVSRRFDIKLEDLARAYTKGAIDGMNSEERKLSRT